MNSSEARRKLGNYGLTPFEIDVLLATLAIPKGRTATYKQIAERIGHKNAYRAVGSALKKNPLAPIIPCHRVIKSDGSIGNYSGGGSKKKLMMLQKEGAII